KGGKGGKGWGGKGGRGGKGGFGEDEREPLSVPVTTLTPTTIERYYRSSGTLQAKRTADLVAVQSGIILDLFAEEGDAVEEDQRLAKLDGRSFRLQAALDTLSANNARRELERLESIRNSDAIAKQELDQQRFALESALAAARVSKHQVSLTEVRAPFAGTITARHVDIGNLATAASPLFSVADLSALDLELHLPEAEAATVTLGAQVDIELLDKSTFAAKVLRRAPIVDALTGTVKFTIRAEDYPNAAIPGAFARARVLVNTRQNAPSLPVTAVFNLEGAPHVYVVKDGKARRVPVELGLEGEDRVEIVSGLGADDPVIVDARDGIAEGMKVTPVPEGEEPERGADAEANAADGADKKRGDAPAKAPGERAGGKARGA
ncbi:MAG: efflux RND transporter periplasmic adaptor subunit, partial [Myxococcales bacterium]|nr:efflux RND transporter periplasmic adaptor subunit [Myxococcales bacterium]